MAGNSGSGPGAQKNGDFEINVDSVCESVHMTFQNLKYTVKVKEEKQEVEKVLLNGVTGTIKAGELTAIAGQSGAGKSTLLDVLAGRVPLAALQPGSLVTANSKQIDANFKKSSGYVMQDDVLFPMLTVFETLQYTARLRCRLPDTLRRKRVARVLEDLSLAGAAHTIIGDNDKNRGISGGEKRRVSIAQEFLRDPSVVFMDEVTSGLDSSTAFNVLKLLQDIARKDKRTIVLTIHQPSARLLTLLDKLILVSAGNIFYQGSIDNIFPYFERLGYAADIQANPLEYALDLAERHTDKSQPRKGCKELIDKYQAESGTQVMDAASVSAATAGGAAVQAEEFTYASGFWPETRTLLARTTRNNLREKSIFLTRASSFLFMSLVIGTVFLNIAKGTMSFGDSESIVAYAAFSSAVLIFTTTEALPVFLLERTIFKRETSRGAYRALSYCVSSTLAVLPFLLLLSFIYTLPSFLLVGLRGGEHFFFQIIQIFCTLFAANGFVVMWSAVLPDFISGNSVVTALFAFFFLFGGLFIQRSEIEDDAPWWIWAHYISIFKYAQDGLVRNSIDADDKITCVEGSPPDCMLTGSDIHDVFGANQINMWWNPLILVAFGLLFRTIFFFLLRRIVKK